MAFSNPFDDPQGAFYILRNAQGQFSLWPQQCALPAGWGIVCQPQSQASCQQWLEVHWRDLTPANFTQLQEAQSASIYLWLLHSPASGWQKNCRIYPPPGAWRITLS